MDPVTDMDIDPPTIMHTFPSTLDRISFLPDDIIEYILLLLPLREAARMSILSSTWRNIPEIVLDNEVCQVHSNKEEVNPDKLIWLNIFRILLLHRGTITGLKFCIDKLETCPEVDQLSLFLCGETIQEFMIQFCWYKSYRLPLHLFNNLRKLTLSGCVFKTPPTFRGFHRLAHLAFYEVSFECEDFHQRFISRCPLLEHLTMFRCTGIDSFVIDFPNLKFLSLELCTFTSFGFKRSPLLATVEILDCVFGKSESSNFLIRFFDCLPALESIRVCCFFLQYMTNGEFQRKLPTDIQSLQALELVDISFWSVKEVSWVISLVMSSPNLKNLKIKVDHVQSESEELFMYEEVPDYSSEQLRRVEMEDFSGSVQELEFVKFLLSKLTLLEEFVVKCPVDTDPTKQLVMLKDLVRLPSVSRKAKIIW